MISFLSSTTVVQLVHFGWKMLHGQHHNLDHCHHHHHQQHSTDNNINNNDRPTFFTSILVIIVCMWVCVCVCVCYTIGASGSHIPSSTVVSTDDRPPNDRLRTKGTIVAQIKEKHRWYNHLTLPLAATTTTLINAQISHQANHICSLCKTKKYKKHNKSDR